MDPEGTGYDELYRIVQEMLQWHEHVLPGMTLSVDLRMSSCSNWNNSLIAEKCVRNAISDALRSRGCASLAIATLATPLPLMNITITPSTRSLTPCAHAGAPPLQVPPLPCGQVPPYMYGKGGQVPAIATLVKQQ